MTEGKKTKKLSRRDAIKLLGAVTGATVLANLPSKWKTPEIARGVLPAHAQTSNLGLTIQSCEFNVDMSTGEWSSTPYLPLPLPQSIPMTFTLTFVNTHLTGTLGVEPQPPYSLTVIVSQATGSMVGSIIPTSDNSDLGLIVPDSGATSGSVTILWEFDDPSHGSGTCSQTVNWALPTVQTVSIIPQDPDTDPDANFTGNVVNEGSSPITAQGFVWDFDPNNSPDLSDNVIPFGGTLGVGAYSTGNVFVSNTTGAKFGRAYATNSVGTAYGDPIAFTTGMCLVEGTLISMADGTSKKIEDIQYSDKLQVWNFDECRFDEAEPFWIMQAGIAQQYLVFEFSDGSELKSVVQHRIFNKEKGMFTYPMTEDAPIGTTTFNAKGKEVTLVGMRIVNEEVRFYNVITNRHMNLFANGILTSCRYNNIYPIADMKFVKDDRVLISKEAYGEVPIDYYDGLRLAEQSIPVADTIVYINRLESKKVPSQNLDSEQESNIEHFKIEPVI